MYHVIAADGNRYGPVDLATLNQWAADNRVTPTTILEGTDGQRLEASQLPGIVFSSAPAAGAYGTPTMTPPGMGYGAPGYGAPGVGAPGMGASGYAPYGGGQLVFGDDGKKDVTNSYIACAIGFFCCPVIPFIFGIISANKATAKGNPQGRTALIVNIVVLGLQVVGTIARVALKF